MRCRRWRGRSALTRMAPVTSRSTAALALPTTKPTVVLPAKWTSVARPKAAGRRRLVNSGTDDRGGGSKTGNRRAEDVGPIGAGECVGDNLDGPVIGQRHVGQSQTVFDLGISVLADPGFDACERNGRTRAERISIRRDVDYGSQATGQRDSGVCVGSARQSRWRSVGMPPPHRRRRNALLALAKALAAMLMVPVLVSDAEASASPP